MAVESQTEGLKEGVSECGVHMRTATWDIRSAVLDSYEMDWDGCLEIHIHESLGYT